MEFVRSGCKVRCMLNKFQSRGILMQNNKPSTVSYDPSTEFIGQEYNVKSCKIWKRVPKPVTLYSLPWKVSIKDKEPSKLTYQSKSNLSIEELVDISLKESTADINILQVSPFPYLYDSRKITTQGAKNEYEKYLNDDLKAINNNMQFLEKKFSSMFYPYVPNELGVDMSTIEILYNAANGINQRKLSRDFFDSESAKLVAKLHSQTLTEEEKHKLNAKLKTLEPYIDYCSKYLKDKFNQTPFLGMNKALIHSLNRFSDCVFGDMSDALLRLYLDCFIPIDEMRHAFDNVMKAGDSLKDHLQIDKIPSDCARKIAYDLYPNWFVTPKDQYIASLIFKFSKKGLCTNVYVGDPHYEGIKNLLESPPEEIMHETILANTIFDLDLTRTDEKTGETVDDVPPEYKDLFKNKNLKEEKIPTIKKLNETMEEKVEKQVIMEMICNTIIWGDPNLKNQFPYIKKARSELEEHEYAELKKIFKTKYTSYKYTRDKVFN